MTTFPPAQPPRTPSPFPPSLSPSSIDPSSPNPAHAPRTHSGGSRPLLSSRRTSSTSTGANAPPIPSRHAQCELCALVAEARRAFGYNRGQTEMENEAGPSGIHQQSARAPPYLGPQQGSLRSGRSGTGRNLRHVQGRDILYHDEDITAFAAQGNECLVPEGKHVIVVINQHAESVYQLVSPLSLSVCSKQRQV